MKKNIPNLLITFGTIVITLCFGEFMLRKMIFSKCDNFKNLKQPKLYSNQEWEDNYWKLAHLWGIVKPPYPDPLLGWKYSLKPNSFLHQEADKLNGRRPILIYGDSFANCIDSALCYEDYLNNDSIFAKSHFVINYGAGGYGVDQIYTLIKNSRGLYQNPLVIFSFLTFDLDRSGLRIRECQKPYYTLDANGELLFNSSGFNPDMTEYLKQNPPNINSYLWKKFLYSKINFIPGFLKRFLQGETQNREFLKKLNAKLIHETAKEFKESHTDFIVLIFEGYLDFKTSDKSNWRKKAITEIFKNENINCIWARDLIKNNLDPKLKNLDKFLIRKDGHPTSCYNKIVSDEIKRQVLFLEKDY